MSRAPIRPAARQLPRVRTNFEVPTIPVGKQLLAFMPDRLLVLDPDGIGAVGYADLTLDIQQTRFVESEAVPRDATVVGSTWQYVTKSGLLDRRFKFNRELPIAQYDALRFRSASGLNEMLHVSKPGAASAFADAVRALGSTSMR